MVMVRFSLALTLPPSATDNQIPLPTVDGKILEKVLVF
jgi:hypothetical protein